MQKIKLLQTVLEQRNAEQSKWLSNIITISSGLLAILVSMKSDDQCTDLVYYLYVSILISNSIAIITGVIVLYSGIILLDKSFKLHLDNINNTYYAGVVTVSIVYTYLTCLCFFALVTSIITLVSYGIIK